MQFVESRFPRSHLIALAVLACVTLAIVPLAYSNGIIANHDLQRYGKYLCWAVLATSLNLLWGYTGLLCLGQCVFFGLGGYAFGMYLMLNVGVDPVYKTSLPDFMDFLGYTELPPHWKPFENLGFAMAAVIWVPGVMALIFGFLAFRSRITGVYFAIMTQALTFVAWILFLRNEFTFGGNNGFTGFKKILGANLYSQPATSTNGKELLFFVLSALLLIVTISLMISLTRTRFGKVQRAIRDSENRVRFSGYCTENFKLFIFTLAAIMAGLAGALWLPQATGINGDVAFRPIESLWVVVWVAVGGRGTIWGPVIGAILINALKSWAQREYENTWILILGGIFLVVVLFLPGGIASLGKKLPKWFRICRDWIEAFMATRKKKVDPKEGGEETS